MVEVVELIKQGVQRIKDTVVLQALLMETLMAGPIVDREAIIQIPTSDQIAIRINEVKRILTSVVTTRTKGAIIQTEVQAPLTRVLPTHRVVAVQVVVEPEAVEVVQDHQDLVPKAEEEAINFS